MQYVNSANRSPCDVIKKMADFQEDGDRKLQIFAYLHVGVTTLSITIGLYLWYCFIYRNKNFACQWHFNHIWTCCDVYSFNNGWLRGEVRSPQPMPYLHAGGHRDSRPFWARDFLVLETSGLPSQTGHQGSHVFLLPAATPVRHCPTRKCHCSDGNNGGHHPQC